MLVGGLEDNAFKLLLEPLDAVLLVDPVGGTDPSALPLLLGDAATTAAEDAKDVQTVNADRGVVLEAKVNVLVNAKPKVTGIAEVLVLELVLLHAQGLLEDLPSLGATDGSPATDLFVPADTKRPDGVPGLGEAGLLSSQLLKNTGSTHEAITRFSDAVMHVSRPCRRVGGGRCMCCVCCQLYEMKM